MPKAAPVKRKHNASGALARALKFEKQGKRFFSNAAAKASDPFARQVFELLAVLEDKHCQDILAIDAKLEQDGKFPAVSTASSEVRMRMFQRETARLRKEKTVTGDAAAAMRKALGFEAEGREMYRRMADRAAHPMEKKFFRLLSAEEAAHFEVVYEYLEFLEATGLRMGE
ncbi:MAG: ferritin family protein [Deltaproteobacteria bacterium]|nr:ferritin family protein [Deltaproteobacteria bacterium]